MRWSGSKVPGIRRHHAGHACVPPHSSEWKKSAWSAWGESVIHPRVGFGRRRVVYRHYLPELSRKPQAVRQIAPELLAELGEPWGSLWQLLAAAHGQLEAARVLAKLLGTLEEHGEERLRPVLEAALAHHHPGVLDVSSPPASPESITVPDGLANIVIEAAKAADYDHLLLTNGEAHE